MEYIYFTYRRVYSNRGCRYDVSYYNNKQYQDYKDAGLTKMIDGNNFIPDEKIIKELIPGAPSLRRAGVLMHNVPPEHEQLKNSLINVGKGFAIELKTKEEMLEWIRTGTSLEEVSEGKFLIEKADGEMIKEDKYLEII